MTQTQHNATQQVQENQQFPGARMDRMETKTRTRTHHLLSLQKSQTSVLHSLNTSMPENFPSPLPSSSSATPSLKEALTPKTSFLSWLSDLTLLSWMALSGSVTLPPPVEEDLQKIARTASLPKTVTLGIHKIHISLKEDLPALLLCLSEPSLLSQMMDTLPHTAKSTPQSSCGSSKRKRHQPSSHQAYDVPKSPWRTSHEISSLQRLHFSTPQVAHSFLTPNGPTYSQGRRSTLTKSSPPFTWSPLTSKEKRNLETLKSLQDPPLQLKLSSLTQSGSLPVTPHGRPHSTSSPTMLPNWLHMGSTSSSSSPPSLYLDIPKLSNSAKLFDFKWPSNKTSSSLNMLPLPTSLFSGFRMPEPLEMQTLDLNDLLLLSGGKLAGAGTRDFALTEATTVHMPIFAPNVGTPVTPLLTAPQCRQGEQRGNRPGASVETLLHTCPTYA
jgi:hypothetical protein